MIDGHWTWEKFSRDVHRRVLEELAKLDLTINEEKTRWVDMTKDETFGFLGFEFRRVRTRRGKWGVHQTPKRKARTALLGRLTDVFRRFRSQPLTGLIEEINPILRGWVNYFRIGQSSRCFAYVSDWVLMKIRRHLQRAQGRRRVGWQRWSREWLYRLGLYHDYQVRYYQGPKVAPAQ